MGEHQKLEAVLARLKHKSHIGLGSLSGWVLAAAPSGEVVLEIVAVRFRVSQRSCNLESRLLQNRRVPIVVVRKGPAQIDQIVFDKSRVKEDRGVVKDGRQRGFRLCGRQREAPRPTSASTRSRIAAVRPGAPGSKCASRAR
jgi:hypothetical protein